MVWPKPLNARLVRNKKYLVSPDFISSPDIEGAFPTRGDRFAAECIHMWNNKAPFTIEGSLLQILTGATFSMSAVQLRTLADAVGRERIQTMHGGADLLIDLVNNKDLVEGLGKVKNTIFENTGHIIPMERKEAFRSLILEIVEKTANMKVKDTLIELGRDSNKYLMQ